MQVEAARGITIAPPNLPNAADLASRGGRGCTLMPTHRYPAVFDLFVIYFSTRSINEFKDLAFKL